jgi:toxin ParE1/3/4
MARVIRTADALEDVTAIWLYVAQHNLSAADRLLDEIDRVLNLIASFPLIGESVDHLRAGTRRFTVGNYQLFYEPIEGGIRLLRVYHAARRLEDLFNE